MQNKKSFFVVCLVAVSSISILVSGCLKREEREVVIYAALDKEFSEPILQQFESETGIHVKAKYDQESNKTVGLVQAILSERDRPRCDVFWNNEILHSLRLQEKGLLEVYRSDTHNGFPEAYRSQSRQWHGFAARARVLLINRELIPDKSNWPSSVDALADPRWKSNCGIARPLFGTTATHAAVLFDAIGIEPATNYFKRISANAIVEGGNKQVAINVARGKYAFGLTDTDDAIIEIEKGANVEIVFPDQGDDQRGTLFIPNTLCIIKDGPNSESAKRLVDYLLSPGVEKRLAEGPSGQIPLGPNVNFNHRLDYADVKQMKVDFERAANSWDKSRDSLADIFAIGK